MLIRNKLIRRIVAIEYKKTPQYKAASTIAITEKVIHIVIYLWHFEIKLLIYR